MTLPCRLIIDEGPWGEGNQDKLGLICHCKMTPALSGAGGPYKVFNIYEHSLLIYILAIENERL